MGVDVSVSVGVGMNQCFLRICENLGFMSPPNLQFEKLGSHVDFLLLPQPAERPLASRQMVYAFSV
jgi:hypothetical protein